MSTITLKKSHFRGRFFLMSDGSVTNGHWALKKEVIKNALTVASVDAAIQTYAVTYAKDIESTFEQVGPSGELHEWTGTAFLNDLGRTVARIFKSTKTGELVGLDVRYLEIMGLNEKRASVYGAENAKPFVNAPTLADSVFIIMPDLIDALPEVNS